MKHIFYLTKFVHPLQQLVATFAMMIQKILWFHKINPFPNKPVYLLVCSLLKILWEEEKLLVIDSVARTIINLRKTELRLRRGSNLRPPVLKSGMLQTELRKLSFCLDKLSSRYEGGGGDDFLKLLFLNETLCCWYSFELSL